jgi:hypothetical protein
VCLKNNGQLFVYLSAECVNIMHGLAACLQWNLDTRLTYQ